MALVTRCSNPACLTLFRVTPAQLQAFGGQVRCGSCSTVFDAFPSLTTVADSALTPPSPPATPPPTPPAPVPAAADMSGTGEHGAAADAADAGTTAASSILDQHRNADQGHTDGSENENCGADRSDAERSDTGRSAEDHREADGNEADGGDRPDPGGRPSGNPVAPDPAAPDIQDFGAGEKVSEWTTAEVAPGIDAGSPPQPMAVEQVPDLPPEGSLDFVHAPAGSLAEDADGRATAVAPHEPDEPQVASDPRPVGEAALVQTMHEVAAATPAVVAAAALPADPVPQIVPELTDYSVTTGPPPRAASPQRQTSLVPVVGGLLLVAAAVILVVASDRLPTPLSHWLAPATLAALLREQALPVTLALVALLCFMLRRHRATWIVAAIVLALLLGGQAVFAYRTQIAALHPASRPLLENLCRLVSCEVGLPKAADQLVIESSDLQAVDVAKPNLIQLAASVRNRASIDVAFPAIEITLTDAKDRPLVRRVLLPEQYLEGRQPVRAGLRAGEDFSIRLTLDTTELRPVGYRLYLFYP